MTFETLEIEQSPHAYKPKPKASDNLVTIWCLRILVRLDTFYRFSEGYRNFQNEELLRTIGLHEFHRYDQFEQRKMFDAIGQRLMDLESIEPSTAKDTFSRNIGVLQEALSLSANEMEILRFAVVASTAHGFGHLLDILGEMNNEKMKRTLSTILNMPLPEIEYALRADNTLLSSGILRIESNGGYMLPLRAKLDVPSGIKVALSQEHEDTSTVLQCFFRKASSARLNINDFPHINVDTNILHGYLRASSEQKTRGVNILLYGEPGTGKTELVRTLADSCGLKLYEITMQAMDGSPIEGKDRLSAYQLSQKLLAREKNCAILFDEIEDVFPATRYMITENATSTIVKKAWINNLLEENPIPAFWVTNATAHIEASFLRRFDYTLKLRSPTRAMRRRILDKYVGHLPVRDSWLNKMAEHQQLAPAHIERASKVAAHLQHQTPDEVERTLDKVIGNTLEVMGLPRKPRVQTSNATRYNLAFLNPDQDLQKLTEGLKHRPIGRLCLYGAPGSGKSAFGQYLAEQLDKSLLIKRASDILSKWVGEAEQNIASMFQEAEADDMILLLDEADSFLQDRSTAQHSWEITFVNELLVQMEVFDGLFIASTNLMEHLDAASLRRFDLKIKFGYLHSHQAWELFNQVLHEHQQQPIENAEYAKNQLAQLDNLTPGDFATVVRQARSLRQDMTSQFLLKALYKECESKPGNRKSIGFLASNNLTHGDKTGQPV